MKELKSDRGIVMKVEFGQRLLYLLSKKDMSQKDLSTVLNLNPTTINKYIKGTRFPDEDTILKISEFFNTTIDYLYGKTDDPRGYIIVKNNDTFEVKIKDGTVNLDKKKLESLLEKLSELGINPKELE